MEMGPDNIPLWGEGLLDDQATSSQPHLPGLSVKCVRTRSVRQIEVQSYGVVLEQTLAYARSHRCC